MQFLRFWENLFVKFSDDFRYKSSDLFFSFALRKNFCAFWNSVLRASRRLRNYVKRVRVSDPVKCAQSSRERKSEKFFKQIRLRALFPWSRDCRVTAIEFFSTLTVRFFSDPFASIDFPLYGLAFFQVGNGLKILIVFSVQPVECAQSSRSEKIRIFF